jgi:hypothetical protein
MKKQEQILGKTIYPFIEPGTNNQIARFAVFNKDKSFVKFLYNNKTYTKQAVYAVKPDIAWNFYTAEVLSEINTLLMPLLEESFTKTTLKECLKIEKKFIAYQKSILKTKSTQPEISK